MNTPNCFFTRIVCTQPWMLGAALARFPRVPVSMHGISTNSHLVSILQRVIELMIVICCMLASRPKPFR
jgi:hypothetical protein